MATENSGVSINRHTLGHHADDAELPPLVFVPWDSRDPADCYEMVDKGELGIQAQLTWTRFHARLDELKAEPGDEFGMLTLEQEAQIEALELSMCHIALPDCPMDKLRTLKPRERGAVLNAFFAVTGVRQMSEQIAVELARMQMRMIREQMTGPTPRPPLNDTSDSETPPTKPSRKSSTRRKAG